MADPTPPQETPGLKDAASTAQELAFDLYTELDALVVHLFRKWNAYQIGIALALFLAAWLLARFTGPMLQRWVRRQEGWPKWRLRLFVTLHKRLRLIYFVGLIWPTIWIMREITWNSRSYLLGIIAALALSWLVIAIIARLISNPLLRGIARVIGWAWATVVILGLTEEATTLLSRIAIDIGSTHISALIIFQALLTLIVLFTLARFAARSSTNAIRKNENISASMQELTIKLLQVLLYAGAFFLGLQLVGVNLTGLAVLSGAIGVGLGFGLQKVVSNLVSGVIILLDKSIKPGDVISLGDTFGWINALGARYVSVITRDGKEYLIPNEDLITGQVVNWSHSSDYVRLDLYFGTAYADDPHLVRKVAIEACQGVSRVLTYRPPVCHIVGFGDSSVDYILRFWISDPTGGLTNIRGNVYLALWDAFKEHGISIPFPQREVRMLEED